MQFPQALGYMLSQDYEQILPLQRELHALISHYNLAPTPDARQRITECISRHEQHRLSTQLEGELSAISRQIGDMGEAKSSLRPATAQIDRLLVQLLQLQEKSFSLPNSLVSQYIEAQHLSETSMAHFSKRLEQQILDRQVQELKSNQEESEKRVQSRQKQAGVLKGKLDDERLSYQRVSPELEDCMNRIGAAVEQLTSIRIIELKTQISKLQQHFDNAIRKYAAVEEEIRNTRFEDVGDRIEHESAEITQQIADLDEEIRAKEDEYVWEQADFNEKIELKEKELAHSQDGKQLIAQKAALQKQIADLEGKIRQKNERRRIE